MVTSAFQSSRAAALLAASFLIVLSAPVIATNGYLSHAVGTRAKGTAGAGVAAAQGASAIDTANNPALGAFAAEGIETGIGLFSPRRSFTPRTSAMNGEFGAFSLTAGDRDSDSNWFPVPWLAKAWKMRNSDGVVGFTFYGRGGMNTDWHAADGGAVFNAGDGTQNYPGVYGAGDAGVDLMQAIVGVTYASRIGERLAWGVTPQIALQTFEARGLGNVAPFSFAPFTRSFVQGQFPTHLSDRGHDFSWGWGVSAGIWWQASNWLSTGLAYQSKYRMTEFDRYADLFAEQGDFDIPASFRAGIALRATDRLTVQMDVERIYYEGIPSVSNSARALLQCPSAGGGDPEACLGGNRGAGFGWQNMTVYKAGFQWRSASFGTWRGGYSYAKQPIAEGDALFNILAPGVMEEHWTIGASFERAGSGKLNFAIMYAPSHTIRGPNFLDPTQTIELQMHQYELEVSYAWQ